MAVDPLSQEDAAERLRMILNSAKDGIIALDPRGCIDGVNPAIERMFGYSEEELSGNGIGILYEEKPTPAQVASFLSYIRSKAGQTSSSKFRGRRKDGSVLVCDVAVTPMHLSNGVHYVAIVRDITERIRIEEMKNQFVATVSHELRTPLTSISGSLGLLAGGAAGDLPPNALKLVKIAHSNSERLVRLINDILDIEKLESGKMAFEVKPVRLAPLINQSLEGVGGFAEQYGVQLQLLPDLDHAAVLADSDRLMQVMTNLLSNAIKFSPQGEMVTVEIGQGDQSYRVSVSNAGEGIPDEFRDRIFSRFAQADASSTREQGGTGLGLNIVKEIVTRLGGQVGFDSRPGQGATFYFTLPAASRARDKILICTPGSKIPRDTRALASLDIDVRFAQTLEEMRDLVSANSFCAVILDLRLTQTDRAKAVQAIQTHAKNSPVIILAGNTGLETGRLPLPALLEWLELPSAQAAAPTDHPLSAQPPEGRILHVEDDEDILSLVEGAFGSRTEVLAARNVEEGLAVIREHRLDAVILDLDLERGGESGLALLPHIRLLHPAVPVVIFSASDAEASAGSGVDAVLTKSRDSLDEVVSTVRALISSGRES
ncbi:MAG TPA: ATP-binding protein [Allosphingosinicella sp.]|nr:ATP-binding protein [Allosphingosinicella sp.]